MFRGAVIAGLLTVGAFQPLFGDDFKFKVTSSKDYTIGLTITGGPLLLLDACWAKAGTDLDWLIVCEYPAPLGVAVAAASASTEEKCEDLQVGIYGGNDGIQCTATLFSNGGTGKGQGSLRFTGTEFLGRQGSVKAARISLDRLPEFREKVEEFKAIKRARALVE